MINVIKLGTSFYKDKVDKNSGTYEVELIKEACSKVMFEQDKKVLVIINGIADDLDRKFIDAQINDYDIKIFIASDICFKDNVDIINKCDFLLHQAMTTEFYEYCYNLGVKNDIKFRYSYVPELFYIPVKEATYNKRSISCVFGGGHINEDVLNEYAEAYPTVLYTRNSEIDNRLPYYKYREELLNYPVTLIIARDDYQLFGWITARYYEALASNCVPLLAKTYDICDYLNAGHLRVYDCNHYAKLANEYATNISLRITVLLKLQDEAAEISNNFIEQMEDIINGRDS